MLDDMASGNEMTLESPLKRTRAIRVEVNLMGHHSLSVKGLLGVAQRESENLCMHGHF